MLVPTNISDVPYDEYIELGILGMSDYEYVAGKMAGGERQLQAGQASDLGFTWEVAEHTPLDLVIQIEFDNQTAVSQSGLGYDELHVKILKPEVFRSAQSLLSYQSSD